MPVCLSMSFALQSVRNVTRERASCCHICSGDSFVCPAVVSLWFVSGCG